MASGFWTLDALGADGLLPQQSLAIAQLGLIRRFTMFSLRGV